MIISYGAQNINGINTIIDYCLKKKSGGREEEEEGLEENGGRALSIKIGRATVIL